MNGVLETDQQRHRNFRGSVMVWAPGVERKPIINVEPHCRIRLRLKYGQPITAVVKTDQAISRHVVLLTADKEAWELYHRPERINAWSPHHRQPASTRCPSCGRTHRGQGGAYYGPECALGDNCEAGKTATRNEAHRESAKRTWLPDGSVTEQ